MGAVRILGIDPGLNRTGWGIVESEGNRLRHIAHGVVGSDPDDALSVRLSSIYSELAKIIVTWTPDEAAVEEVFVNKNPGSTLKLGRARGVCLLAQRTGRPVVPVVMIGTHTLNAVAPWLPFRRARLWIAYGEPVFPDLSTSNRKTAREVMAGELQKKFVDLYKELCMQYAIDDATLP